MQYTQAQIDRANAVSLEDFLRTQGETLIKSGREYRWKEHDSLTVRGNKWFRHSQSKGGYPIDFVMEFYGKSFPEAVILSRLVDTFISRISLTMLPVPNPHNTVCVLSWEEARHWQSRSSGYSSS